MVHKNIFLVFLTIRPLNIAHGKWLLNHFGCGFMVPHQSMKWNSEEISWNKISVGTWDAKMSSTSASSLTATPLKRKNCTFAKLILVLPFEQGQEIKSFRVSNGSRHSTTGQKSRKTSQKLTWWQIISKVPSFGMRDLHATWCMHSQVMKKSSPNIPLLRDELPPSDDASPRVTAFFFKSKQKGCLESDQDEAKWTDYKWDAEVSTPREGTFLDWQRAAIGSKIWQRGRSWSMWRGYFGDELRRTEYILLKMRFDAWSVFKAQQCLNLCWNDSKIEKNGWNTTTSWLTLNIISALKSLTGHIWQSGSSLPNPKQYDLVLAQLIQQVEGVIIAIRKYANKNVIRIPQFFYVIY